MFMKMFVVAPVVLVGIFVSVRSSPLDRLRVPAAEVSTYF
jgi:hypothetical protein